MFKTVINTNTYKASQTFDTMEEALRYAMKAISAFPYIGVTESTVTIITPTSIVHLA